MPPLAETLHLLINDWQRRSQGEGKQIATGVLNGFFTGRVRGGPPPDGAGTTG
ncbi:hypothetical protein [Streptomyces sp. NPDC048295]|uniref:hypothetical protein n=1 Tax=Streptomyces sp. NPDC048295 TaxID=3154617 RepID=UPI00341EC231